jgi:UDP-N-acetylmuramoyl-L-alanyl-D-glutamate--2,6-diaminopimelate ligase
MVYITEEDAGEEPLANISGEIAQYIQKARTNYEIIDDREEAIKRAIQMAPQNCILLITGKGRETRQKRDSLYIDTLSDVEIVERILSHEE